MKYHLALKKAIKALTAIQEPVRVLDIGTGTGLLAMMAAKANASSVTACEVIINATKPLRNNSPTQYNFILDISTYGELCKECYSPQWIG